MSTVLRKFLGNYYPDQLDRLRDLNSKSLDKETFNFTVEADCVAVDKPYDVGVIMPLIKPFLFRVPNLNPVIRENPALILIDSLRLKERQTSLTKLIEHVTLNVKITRRTVDLSYKNFSVDDIFSILLPEDISVSGYSQIGHIIHLNLAEEQVSFKKLIAQVLLDKIPKCQTVINKNENVNGLHRNLNFELLAGKEEYVTKVKENGLIFELDYSKVFFNPRLGTERERFLDFLQFGDLIYDIFAGVGPFSIQAAVLKRCRVLANDINQDCTRYLEKNIQLNRAKNVQVSTMDGEKFMTEVAAKDLAEQLSNDSVPKACHFIMNLPAIATQFLKFFRGALNHVQLTERAVQNLDKIKIFVHCYYFAKKYDSYAHGERNSEDMKSEATDIIKKEFDDSNFELKDLRVEFVRSVAPSKHMMRATFSINRDILC